MNPRNIIIHLALGLFIGIFIGMAAVNVGTVPVCSDTPYTTAIVIGMVTITCIPAVLAWMGGYWLGRDSH